MYWTSINILECNQRHLICTIELDILCNHVIGIFQKKFGGHILSINSALNRFFGRLLAAQLPLRASW